MYSVSEPASLEQFLKEMSDLQSQSIVADNAAGQIVSTGIGREAMLKRINEKELAEVFAGGTVRMEQFSPDAPGSEPPAPPAIGKLVKLDNEGWALFVQPDRFPQNSNFKWTAVTLLARFSL